MAEWFGSDLEMVVLENGDFYHSSAVAVDTRRWTSEMFREFDNCEPRLRQLMAVKFDAQIRNGATQEDTLPRGLGKDVK